MLAVLKWAIIWTRNCHKVANIPPHRIYECTSEAIKICINTVKLGWPSEQNARSFIGCQRKKSWGAWDCIIAINIPNVERWRHQESFHEGLKGTKSCLFVLRFYGPVNPLRSCRLIDVLGFNDMSTLMGQFVLSLKGRETRGPWWPCNTHLSNIALWEPDLELIKANILIKVQNDYINK